MTPKHDAFSDNAFKVIGRMAKEIACEAFGVAHIELHGNQRGNSRLSLARQTGMYLAHVVGQLTLNETASLFRRDRSTVSHACINIEDRRDSPVFDLQIEYMEKRLRERIDAFRRDRLSKTPPVPERKSQICMR